MHLIASGDIPTPRSGHAVASYGKYLFLYGGINFAEEVAYNDLYILNTGEDSDVPVSDHISILRISLLSLGGY